MRNNSCSSSSDISSSMQIASFSTSPSTNDKIFNLIASTGPETLLIGPLRKWRKH